MDVALLESEYADAAASQFIFAPGVVLHLLIMHSTVYFHRQSDLGAVEVEHEAADRMLSAEADSQLPAANGPPEPIFAGRWVPALLTSELYLRAMRNALNCVAAAFVMHRSPHPSLT